MPLYTYKNEETGALTDKQVPVDERDKQDGFTRVLNFKGLVWAPTAGGLR